SGNCQTIGRNARGPANAGPFRAGSGQHVCPGAAGGQQLGTLKIEQGLRMKKILIAEDERDIRDLIAFTLRFAGYEVLTANNGEEAVQMTQKELPDLVLTDVRMPKMTGYEACKQIKADPATAHIPVVFLSAKGQEAEVQSGLA